jgi:hypothetical protein
MDKKLKHLEFIQSAVGRMASNLFLLKGWTITLIAALFALAAKDSNKGYALLAYIPVFVFWALDGYFLSQERRFRALYDHVRELPEEKIDFSMDASRFGSDPRNRTRGAMMSSTLLGYYGPLLVITFIVMMWV